MSKRIRIFGMAIDTLSMDQAVSTILGWTNEKDTACRYVVTPNVDHVLKFQNNKRFRWAYAKAALALADGKPLVWASRMLGAPIPETVPGSDLLPALLRAAQGKGGLSLYLLGSLPGVAECAAAHIRATCPAIRVVGTYSPPFGFEMQDRENRKILESIAENAPDLLVVGFGAPKQEIWVAEHAKYIRARVVLCAGASIDFLAGAKVRAPVWMRKLGLEWLQRMMTNPRRLFLRYALDVLIFPYLVIQEWIRLKTSSTYTDK